MTVNDLLNILTDAIRKGTVTANAAVELSDGLPVFVYLEPDTDTVCISDVDPNETDVDS